MNRFTFESFDGKKISCAEWPVDNPKAVVLIVHGMAEHILRYDYFASQLNAAGYLVVGDDHRGHGKTDPDTFGYAKGNMFYDTLKDMATICKMYKEKYPGLKIILFSHSYGSFLSQRFIEEYNRYLSGIILGGSANMSGALPYIAGVIAGIGCTFKGEDKPSVMLNNLTFEAYKKQLKSDSFISTIDEEKRRYESDPECGFICSYNFYRWFFKGLRDIYKKKNLSKINTEIPMLVISGAKDPVGGYSKLTTKLYDMYRDLGVKDIKLKLYDGVYHEYLNDTSREDAKNEIIAFCDKVVG